MHYALFPGSYGGVVSSNDLLRLVFELTLIVGWAADLRASSNALVAAEAELDILREAELARVALQERARLAREIHDGLSQHLWLAKLRLERMAGLGASTEVQGAVRDLSGPGFGLTSMRERIEGIGGKLIVESAPESRNDGTRRGGPGWIIAAVGSGSSLSMTTWWCGTRLDGL